MTIERAIHCHKCKVYVGTIRDAKLMKGLKFVCPKCDDLHRETNRDDMFGDGFTDLLKDSMFGDIFGKYK